MGIATKILGTLLLSFVLLLPLHLSIIFAEKPDSANSPSAKPVNISEYAANIPSDELIVSLPTELSKTPEEQEPLSEITEDVLPDESEDGNPNQNEEVNYPSDDRIVSPPPEVKKPPEKQEPPSKVVEDTASNDSEDGNVSQSEGVIQNYPLSNVSVNNPDIHEAVRIVPEEDKPLLGKGKSKGDGRDPNKTGGKDAPTQNKESTQQNREDKERNQNKESSEEASVQNKESKGDTNKDTNGKGHSSEPSRESGKHGKGR